MASTITAGNATNGLGLSSDNTGVLQIKTGAGVAVTAVTINDSQNTIFAGNVTSSGGVVGAVIQTQTISSGSGTWTKPTSGYQWLKIEVWGGGGSGGRSNNTFPASGGGGGAYNTITVPLSYLAAAETYTIGAGGLAISVTGSGNIGGDSSFVLTNYPGGAKTISAFGGGGGWGGSAAASGGSGGGIQSAGATSTGNTATVGGGPIGGVAGGVATSIYGGGAGGQGNSTGSFAHFGGGGGAASAPAGGPLPFIGGGSWYGGAGGASTEGIGTAVGGASVFGGAGGASAANGGTAGSGVAPGGGGGGSENGISGAGGAGSIILTWW